MSHWFWPPSWKMWPWRAKRQWVFNLSVPEAYVNLNQITNVYDPYKKKAVFLFFLGMGVIAMLDIPGLFFTNPYSHIVEGPAAYLGILGGIVVGIMGLAGIVVYQYYKDYEVMQFTFGAFNLRARKNYRASFHALLGTIERVPNELAEELKAILDKKMEELRQVAKVHPIDVAAQPTGPAPQTAPAQTAMVQGNPPPPPIPTGRREDLHLFWIPTPGLPIPGVALLSYANFPEELTCPLPGEWIWEGWIRHAKGEVFDLGVCGEWQFKLPGSDETYLVPICTAAGTYFDFTWGLQRAMKPPQVDTEQLLTAKANIAARAIGLEAVNTLQIYTDAEVVRKLTENTMLDNVTNMVGGILELLQSQNKLTPTPTKPKTRWGLYVGVTLLISALIGAGWLASHGWHL